MLAGIASASVQGRVAWGPRTGARVRRLGREPGIEAVTSRGPCQAHLEGFDLHAVASGSSSGRGPRMGGYVTGTGATSGACGAGGR